jgi:hypothetical protein
MYIVQESFLPFEKREVKCYYWTKISKIDFNKKTLYLFNQFVEENIVNEKLKSFDHNVLPLIERYFNENNENTIKTELN